MDLKLIAIITAVLVIVIAAGGYIDHKLSFNAGASSRDAACTQARAADKAAYLDAQQKATAIAAAAQQTADAAQLADVRNQLATAQAASLSAQTTADNATATANQLTATLKRLRNENKDTDAWSVACLPGALLDQLHPDANAQAAGRACRATRNSNAH